MKVIALLVLLAIIATTVFAKEHCIDRDFTVNAVLVEPSQQYDDFHTIYFSADTQKQRIDINEFEPEVRSFSVYQRFDQGKMYIYDKETKKCETQVLQGKLQPFCLATNANHTGTVVIGGSLKADVWEESQFGFNIRLVLSSFGGIPINILSKGGAHKGVVMQEWFNYKQGVDSDSIFNVPAACNQNSARMLTANIESGIPVRSVVEKVNKLSSGYMKH